MSDVEEYKDHDEEFLSGGFPKQKDRTGSGPARNQVGPLVVQDKCDRYDRVQANV